MLGQADELGLDRAPQVSNVSPNIDAFRRRPKVAALLLAVAALSMLATGCLSGNGSPVVGPPSYEDPPQQNPPPSEEPAPTPPPDEEPAPTPPPDEEPAPTPPPDEQPVPTPPPSDEPAPTPPPTEAQGQLVGSVRYSRSAPPGGSQSIDLPLLNATVKVDGQVVVVNKGVFQVGNLSPGLHTVQITSPHFVTKTEQVEIRSGSTVDVRFEMTPRYSGSDLDLLARLVRAEAGAEPYIGQVAVAATVLNRVLSPIYPDTIPGVVFQVVDGRYVQYEPVLNGTINIPADASAVYAASDALAGWDPSGGASGFYNPDKTTNQWVRLRPVTVRIGNHVFFL